MKVKLYLFTVNDNGKTDRNRKKVQELRVDIFYILLRKEEKDCRNLSTIQIQLEEIEEIKDTLTDKIKNLPLSIDNVQLHNFLFVS